MLMRWEVSWSSKPDHDIRSLIPVSLRMIVGEAGLCVSEMILLGVALGVGVCFCNDTMSCTALALCLYHTSIILVFLV